MAHSFDGAVRSSSGMASSAGVFRNDVGGWIFGKLIIDTDSKCAIDLINNIPVCHPTLTRPLRLISKFLTKDWVGHLSHTYREANQVADALANLLLDSPAEIAHWIQPPKEILLNISADCSGTFFPHDF
ncbi:hypothetical protein PIB30_072041 [Stylosanthes scabra]|uniref:RNase H type-1 domain-containing protein n=1 Tax=Stylosanthes scabra TaxID=79078 RepID=A0ABU6UNV9_9FABA|nr:hypothetical protein [Stylosanthes scabra]